MAARPVWAIGVGTGAAVQLLLALNERRAGEALRCGLARAPFALGVPLLDENKSPNGLAWFP